MEKVQTDERTLTTSEIPGAILEHADGRIEQHEGLQFINDGVPTQVANPKRATLRTVLAVLAGLVVALPLVNTMLAILQEELDKVTAFDIPGWIYLAINIGIGAVALISGLVTRWMAAAKANEWIKTYLPSLAAIPLRSVDE